MRPGTDQACIRVKRVSGWSVSGAMASQYGSQKMCFTLQLCGVSQSYHTGRALATRYESIAIGRPTCATWEAQDVAIRLQC